MPNVLTSQDILDIAAQLDTADSLESLKNALILAMEPFGFKGFTFAVVRRVKNVHLHVRILSTWPNAAQTTFEQEPLWGGDPVIIRSRTARRAFAWDLSIYDPEKPGHQRILELRRSLGVTGGVCVPIHEAWHGRNVLFLTGDGFDCDKQTVLGLEMLTAHLSSRIHALSQPNSAPDAMASHVFMSDGELSPRERQVIGWIAFGKSSKDVAGIMSISEHTVNDYIASIMAKLKASNRTEATLRALLTNQIDLS